MTHFALLEALGSPLNKEGLLQVYVHTNKNRVICVDQQVGVPKWHAEIGGLLDKEGDLTDEERVELVAMRRLHESKPMLGTRGVRLGVIKAGLYAMQVRALLEAAAKLRDAGKKPIVEIMIPLTVTREELALARSWVQEEIDLLVKHSLILYIRVTEKAEEDTLISRAQSSPKPLYYRPAFLAEQMRQYLDLQGLEYAAQVDPDDFCRWVFPRLFHSRVPRYEAIARPHGYTVTSYEVAAVRDERDFLELLESAIERKAGESQE